MNRDPRFPLVPQGMIDAVRAARFHTMDQQSLQFILQAAMEWQQREGCVCCRVLRALDSLAHELAYENACAAVDCASRMDAEGWMLLDDLEEYEKEGIERDFLYLEQRGLIDRDPERPAWFQIRDESEAAVDVFASVKTVSSWRVVNKFVKEEFCPVFDTEEEAVRNFNRFTPNDVRIERLDTTVTVVKAIADEQMPEAIG